MSGRKWSFGNEGHRADVLLVSSSHQPRRAIDTFQLNDSPNQVGMAEVYWNGADQPAWLYNGGWLWNLETRQAVKLPDLPPPGGKQRHRMGFYHAIAADLCGDAREDLVAWDPTARYVYIYTAGPLVESAYQGYQAGPRQYNARLMD